VRLRATDVLRVEAAVESFSESVSLAFGRVARRAAGFLVIGRVQSEGRIIDSSPDRLAGLVAAVLIKNYIIFVYINNYKQP
jgi:hypothetical protein